MTFNWFNRFKQNEDAEKQPEPAQAEPTPTDETPAEAEETAVSQQEQQLAYAKAMLENIKKRQQEKAAATEPEAVPEEAPPEVIAEPEPQPSEETAPVAAIVAEESSVAAIVTEEATEAPAEASIEEVPGEAPAPEPEPESAPEPVIEASGSDAIEEAPSAIEESIPETVAEAPVTEPAVEPEPQPAAPTPFWAQAEADRQARLERLRASAIEEETPEPVATPAAAASSTPVAPAVELPDFTLDEGFLWSADVLAAMGRRAEDVSIEEITWLKRLRQGLDKTRRGLINQLKAIVGQGPLNQDAVYEIEALLLQADAGVQATDKVIEALQDKLRQETLPPDQAIAYLKQILRDLLDQPLQGSHSAFFAPEKDTLNIWLITGVNGAGKTTTIGKLAHIGQKSGYNCLIAAADTFRAAAVEQVKVWGQRSDVEVIANPGKNTDPAAVVFDAITAAQSRGTELLLVDTAGRLQNKKNLMDELSKVRRIIDRKAGDAKIESLLVLDATLGQNGLRQAEVFAQAAQLSGVVLTKLDGTAKGGIALAVVEQLGLPIRFIGAGEGIEDLRPFSSYEFVEALISG